MALQVEIKAIKPKDMDVSTFRRAVERGLDSGAKVVQKSFGETTATFQHRPPIKITSRPAYRLIWVDDQIYVYVSEGTSIRWALMSRDWRSKTRPGRIPSGPGRGRVVIAGRRAMQQRGIGPRPGIKGRKFDQQIAKRDASGVQRGIEKEIKDAANKVF